MKKMLAVTLAVLMAGIVAGCGTKTGPGEPGAIRFR